MPIKVPIVKKIPRHLSTLPSKVFSEAELSRVIYDFARAINDPLHTSPEDYIEYLVKYNKLRHIQIKGTQNTFERYLIGSPSIEEIGVSLKPEAYISHLTAAYIHGLVKYNPPVIYISVEASKRSKQEMRLKQEAIDAAFQKQQRHSAAQFDWDGNRFLLLTSQYTDRKGITKNKYPVTNIERTLLDMTVRPLYGGGADTILQAYRNAVGKLDVKCLIKMLEEINFIYPYHQSVGLYLSMSGYDEKELNYLKSKPMPYRFYLEYGMTNPKYSNEWNIYYPETLIADKS